MAIIDVIDGFAQQLCWLHGACGFNGNYEEEEEEWEEEEWEEEEEEEEGGFT